MKNQCTPSLHFSGFLPVVADLFLPKGCLTNIFVAKKTKKLLAIFLKLRQKLSIDPVSFQVLVRSWDFWSGKIRGVSKWGLKRVNHFYMFNIFLK